MIYLLVWDITEYSYRIATLTEYGDEKTIYYTPDANYRIISGKLVTTVK